jgi:hypothetical protein
MALKRLSGFNSRLTNLRLGRLCGPATRARLAPLPPAIYSGEPGTIAGEGMGHLPLSVLGTGPVVLVEPQAKLLLGNRGNNSLNRTQIVVREERTLYN